MLFTETSRLAKQPQHNPSTHLPRSKRPLKRTAFASDLWISTIATLICEPRWLLINRLVKNKTLTLIFGFSILGPGLTVSPAEPPQRVRMGGVDPETRGKIMALSLSLSPLHTFSQTERDLEKHSEQQRQENQGKDWLAPARLGSGAQAVKASEGEERRACPFWDSGPSKRGCSAEDFSFLPSLFWNRMVYLCAISLP